MKLYCAKNGTAEKHGIRCCQTADEAFYCGIGDVVVEVDADIEDVVVGEGAFEQLENGMFEKSLVPVVKYRLGSYVRPVYFAGKVSGEKDCPKDSEGGAGLRLFESSDRFYIECLSQRLREKFSNYDLYAARSSLEALCRAGRMKRSETDDFIFFEDVNTSEIIPICKRYIK